MNFLQASRYADRIVEWLGPFCERIEIAGSIRRRRPVCGDVDLVCIPKTERRPVDQELFGPPKVEAVDLLREELLRYVRESAGEACWLGQGEVAGPEPRPGACNLLLRLPKCQLDVWLVTPATWATRLLCRTGSKEHNIWLCQRAAEQGGHWNPYQGLTLSGGLVPAQTETDIYEALGLALVPPEERDWPALGWYGRGSLEARAKIAAAQRARWMKQGPDGRQAGLKAGGSWDAPLKKSGAVRSARAATA